MLSNLIKKTKIIATNRQRLQEYIQIQARTNKFTNTIHIYFLSFSSQAQSFITYNFFPLFQKIYILSKKNALQSSNLFYAAWVHQLHPEYVGEVDVKKESLENFLVLMTSN